MPLIDESILRYLSSAVDIAIVWFIVYKIILIVQGTKAVQLLKGVTVIIAVKYLSAYFNLYTLERLMQEAINYGLLAVIIIFQPEVRRALEQLGRGRLFSRSTVHEEDEVMMNIEAIAKATEYMAKRRIGALISIERDTGMSDYVETGIPMNAKLSSELLINIFIPNTPLHDGAVILKKGEILAAACYLPLSENPFISKELGTRHRAALGISEVTDSLTVIVSEETGVISLTKNSELHRDITSEELKSLLVKEMHVNMKPTTSSKWYKRGTK
ncbi:diadenylate cyclase CdaA [Priestia taiwanensis]|uniref:Diadenylate cyclase n=1 Tax=Priestia taiwanensis TaxID=1347902 RepID=A0A917AWI3_9BACI|nr:diadenylate cyclase CdaA [Priestia taiwanensis]MBM7365075.1 diadenylate cyclase [Priestia taiwanensis]GGE83864.1 membrane protein [Priestia taiwanensis]